jgi:Fe-S cluster assembly protein SufD
MSHALIDAAAEAARELTTATAAREKALAVLGETGLPGLHDEDWRFTPLSSLDRDWAPAPRAAADCDCAIDGLDAVRIVLVDGWIDEGQLNELPEGLALVRLDELATADVDRSRAFEALNLAATPEPFVLRADGVVEKPVHLVHRSSGGATLASPRVRVELGRNAQLTVIEDHVGTGTGLVNLQVEIEVGANANLSWTRLVRMGDDLRQIASMRIRQDRDSVVRVQAMNLSGALVRHYVEVNLEGENSECALHGLVVGQGSQIADNHSVIRHRANRARSSEHFRNVLDGKSRAVFAGRVVVEEGVTGTDAQQNNANLLLSDDARVDALPQLEIYNDDVKASHGSTLGQLDTDAMFYLRSRGIHEETARAILTWAFANVVVEAIDLAPIRALVRQSVFEHLPAAGLDEGVLGDLA